MHDILIKDYPDLIVCVDSINKSVAMIVESVKSGGKILTCGNGGSAADAMHIVGELMKSFKLSRPINKNKLINMTDPNRLEYYEKELECGIPAISLVNEVALITAYSNDRNPDLIFAQQIFNLGKENDILLALSTSGNSKNVVYATEVAQGIGMKIISITGSNPAKLDQYSDVVIKIPATETDRIQNLTVAVYHEICTEVESSIFA